MPFCGTRELTANKVLATAGERERGDPLYAAIPAEDLFCSGDCFRVGGGMHSMLVVLCICCAGAVMLPTRDRGDLGGCEGAAVLPTLDHGGGGVKLRGVDERV